MGSANESKVLAAIPEFLNAFHNGIELTSEPRELGLCARDGKRHLATSIDGLLQAKIDESETTLPIGIEIKSYVAPKSQDQVATNRAGLRRFEKCAYGDSVFNRIVNNSGYRVQILHHAMVLKLNHILFVQADKNTIKTCLLVEVPEGDRDRLESLLDKYADEHLKWVYDCNASFPELQESRISSGGYTVEPESVRVNLALAKAIEDLVDKAKCPLPRMKHIVPRIVAYWNAIKGSIDVMSRLLLHFKIPLQGASPEQVYIIRMIQLVVIDGFLATKLVKHALPKANQYKSFRKLKKYASRKLRLKSFVKHLGRRFVLPVQVKGACGSASRQLISPGKEDTTAAATLAEMSRLDPKPLQYLIAGKKKKLIDMFNENESKDSKTKRMVTHNAKRIRLDRSFNHQMGVQRDNKKRKYFEHCVLCYRSGIKKKTCNRCPTCHVFLCVEAPEGGRKPCCVKFHSCQRLE
jgi:hypothetical protein